MIFSLIANTSKPKSRIKRIDKYIDIRTFVLENIKLKLFDERMYEEKAVLIIISIANRVKINLWYFKT